MTLEKAPSALRTIGEVAEDVGVATHVLRFWESKFNQIKPQKRRGRRYYRPEDIQTITQIKALLYGNGYTIRGVQKFLASEATIKPAENQNIAAPAKTEPVATPPKQKSNVNTDLFGNPIDAEGRIISDKDNRKFDAEDISKLQQIHKGLMEARKRLKDVA